MTRISLADIWDRTRAFVAAEWALLLPVALAGFALPSMLLTMIAPAPQLGAPRQAGAWLLALPPLAIVIVGGGLTIVALALVPGLSVAEALRRAAGRLPAALGVVVLATLAIVVAGLPLMVLALALGHALHWSAAGAIAFATLLAWGAALMAAVRLIPLMSVIIDRGAGPVAALRTAFALTAGRFWRLLGLMLLAGAAALLVMLATQLAGGSLLLLLGRALGSDSLGRTLVDLLSALVYAGVQTLWTVYTAFLYRALSVSNGA